MTYRLRSMNNSAWEFQILSAHVLVGRGRGNHLVLSDPSSSRQHAQISLVNGEPVVTDLNSTLGTFVNHARTRNCALRAGDIVAFGKEQFRVELIGPTSTAIASRRLVSGSFTPQAALPAGRRGTAISIEEQKEILEKEISRYARQGWRIISRTETSAQMVRDKQASCLLAFILALFFLLPAILYLLLYKGSENLYIEVDERGKIIATR